MSAVCLASHAAMFNDDSVQVIRGDDEVHGIQ